MKKILYAIRVDRKHVLIGIFLFIIIVPGLMTSMGVKLYPNFLEKRQLADWPAVETGKFDLKKFAKGVEDYVNDHFGLRPVFIQGLNLLKYSVFGASANKEVIVGRNGWLFFGTDDSDIGGYQFVNPPTNAELNNWGIALEERRLWLAERGTRFFFMAAPNKATIYPDFLPQWLKRVGNKSRTDGFYPYLRNIFKIDILDLRETLLRARQQHRVYYRLDSHWNQLGAFFSVQHIIGELSRFYPGLKIPKLENFSLESGRLHNPNFAVRIGAPLTESNIRLVPKGGWTAEREVDDTNNDAKATFSKPGSPELPSLVMYGDSFLPYMQRLLAEHFRRAVFYNIWLDPQNKGLLPDKQFPLGLIIAEKPDIVIYERAERSIGLETSNPFVVRLARKQARAAGPHTTGLYYLSGSIADPAVRPVPGPVLPAVSSWWKPEGVLTRNVGPTALLVNGDASKLGYQIASPAIAVRHGSEILLKLPLLELQGRIATGVLCADNSRWIKPPVRASEELIFRTGNCSRIKIIVANNNLPNKAVQASAFILDPSPDIYNDPRLHDRGALLRSMLVQYRMQVELRLPDPGAWTASPNVKVRRMKRGLEVEGDDSQYGYQIMSPLVAVDAEIARFRLPVAVSRGRVAVGVLDETRQHWLLPPAELRQGEYSFKTKGSRLVTIVVANNNTKAADNPSSRFKILTREGSPSDKRHDREIVQKITLPDLGTWQTSPNVKVRRMKRGLEVEGDGSQYGYQILSPPVKVNAEIARFRLSVAVSRGRVAVGVLDETRQHWLLPPAELRQGEYSFKTKGSRMVTIVVANNNKKTANNAASRFTILKSKK